MGVQITQREGAISRNARLQTSFPDAVVTVNRVPIYLFIIKLVHNTPSGSFWASLKDDNNEDDDDKMFANRRYAKIAQTVLTPLPN